MQHRYWVYILASGRNGTLYVGVTNDLSRRVWEHRQGRCGSFTSRYGVTRLVWSEEHRYVNDAIRHEKRIKKYPRQWKLNMIEQANPDWRDLLEALI